MVVNMSRASAIIFTTMPLFTRASKLNKILPSYASMRSFSLLLHPTVSKYTTRYGAHCAPQYRTTTTTTTTTTTSGTQPTDTDSLPLVEECVDRVAQELSSASVPESDVSARYLVSQVVGSHQQFGYKRFVGQQLTNQQVKELDRLVACRLARVPLQYIAGNWDFRQLTLQVRPPVFIPRPETEQLVDLVMEHLPKRETELRLIEVGPGTGCICLSLLHERPDMRITALERSRVAASLTKENATILNLENRLDLIEMKVEKNSNLAPPYNEVRYDALVSNPPYILRKDLMALAPEISLYEDLRALDGGAKGLDVILPILDLAARQLKPAGLVFLEVDPCHPHILPAHLAESKLPFTILKVVKDYCDRDRFIILQLNDH
uniref:peptide chain release factor N(5)-glutamine methyltransferase n=1 Tax=Acartia pacifica TaxID=335913 RepID=A0A0U2LF11_ACAPC|nr:HemK methyltransferase family member [Acartia pacifica]